MKKQTSTIGRLADQAHVNIETIRYYERIGLMPKPPRTEAGHRFYSASHRKRLVFIRRSRELGFTIAEIRELLRLVDNQEYACSEVRAMTEQHLERIRKKIIDLQRLQNTLTTVASQCDGKSGPECPIIDALLDV